MNDEKNVVAGVVDDEVKRLKLKCNSAINYIETLQKTLKEQEKLIAQLQENHMQNSEKTTVVLPEFYTEFNIYWNELCNTVQLALQQDMFVFIENKDYLTIKHDIFIDFVRNYSNTDTKTLIKLWADLGFLRTDGQGNTVFTTSRKGKTARVFRINRAVVDVARGGDPA